MMQLYDDTDMSSLTIIYLTIAKSIAMKFCEINISDM